MNTQVWLLNSLVRLAGWVNSELVGSMRNTERMMFNSVHNFGMPSEMSYLLFISSPCQNHRNYAWKLQSLPESQNRTNAKCFEIKIASAVNQIGRFPSTKSSRNLTVACHRHPTELVSYHVVSKHWSRKLLDSVDSLTFLRASSLESRRVYNGWRAF